MGVLLVGVMRIFVGTRIDYGFLQNSRRRPGTAMEETYTPA